MIWGVHELCGIKDAHKSYILLANGIRQDCQEVHAAEGIVGTLRCKNSLPKTDHVAYSTSPSQLGRREEINPQ